jgi:UDP-N-acetylglucosamine--N-acetylmuramyl-(pentapeptide) pyrophosphoryl-undecaprenol N-acetylglucosamine transferase
MRVVIGTGGTAGHVFPALATADRLRDRLGAEVTFVGRADGQEARLVPEAGYALETVEALPFRRRLSPAMVRAPFAALRAARRCRPVVRGADVVLGMGGYVSVPVALAARRERVPLVVHEQNATPGLANRVAIRWARAAALSFDDTASRLPRRVRAVVTGNPVRDPILRVREERPLLRAEAATALDLEPSRRTVVVFGGSQGAVRLNEATLAAARILDDREDLQILLLTGPRNHEAMVRRVTDSEARRLRIVPFIDRMELAYAAADLMVCRAGATTVAELTACALPSLLVPYPHATGKHQEANARALEGAGAAVTLPDGRATGEAVAERVHSLLDRPTRLASMAEAARGLGRPDAAEALADLVASIGKEGPGSP